MSAPHRDQGSEDEPHYVVRASSKQVLLNPRSNGPMLRWLPPSAARSGGRCFGACTLSPRGLLRHWHSARGVDEAGIGGRHRPVLGLRKKRRDYLAVRMCEARREAQLGWLPNGVSSYPSLDTMEHSGHILFAEEMRVRSCSSRLCLVRSVHRLSQTG